MGGSGGSEHSLDGQKSAMEIYLVHYRQKHGSSYNAAVAAAAASPVDPNGIAVIAFKIEVRYLFMIQNDFEPCKSSDWRRKQGAFPKKAFLS